MQPPTHSSRFQEIDALRGIAALLVLWMHVSELFIKTEAIAGRGTGLFEIASVLDFGRVGVVLFFAISGFVICNSLRGEKKAASQRFLIRRLMRLYPAFWLSVLFAAWLFVSVLGRPIEASTIVANLTMIPVVLGESQILGLYWTLETELVFYLLCWVLFMLGVLRSPWVVAAVMWALMLLFVLMMQGWVAMPDVPQWQSMPYHLSIMLWGGLLRYWYDHPNEKIVFRHTHLPLKWLLLVQLLLILSPFIYGVVVLGLSGETAALMKSVPYVLAIALFWVFGFWFPLRWRGLVWLGTISYSLYLFHPMIFHAVHQLLALLPQSFSEQHLSVYLLVCALFSILLAAAVYYLVEKPAIQLARKWTADPGRRAKQPRVSTSESVETG